MYLERWLNAPVLNKDGELVQKQGKGTSQGGVISPLLANLFLHYTFDVWLTGLSNTVRFVRYADDAIVHCKSRRQAEWILARINERMLDCGV